MKSAIPGTVKASWPCSGEYTSPLDVSCARVGPRLVTFVPNRARPHRCSRVLRRRAPWRSCTRALTAAHKYSAQTRKVPLSDVDAALVAEAAEVAPAVKETPTPAELVADALRAQRGTDADLSPAQARTERVAELARRVRRARTDPEHAAGEHSDAIQAALAKIKAKRDAEQAARDQASQHLDDQAPRHDRGGPGISR